MSAHGHPFRLLRRHMQLSIIALLTSLHQADPCCPARVICAGAGHLRLRGAGPRASLYDILGVEQEASAQEVRTAYRRMALQMHPDKNLQSSEEAAIKFRELQHAYEVLSDPPSRTSYDRQFRQAESVSSYTTSRWAFAEPEEEETIELTRFFGAGAYSGYHEGPDGFWTVYTDVFQRIHSLEPQDVSVSRQHVWSARVDQGGANTGSTRWMPAFGNLSSPYHDVEAFYDAWKSFSSRRDFLSACTWDLGLASNRWERRRMEVQLIFYQNRNIYFAKKSIF
jgi:DnaJ family protein A protein 5